MMDLQEFIIVFTLGFGLGTIVAALIPSLYELRRLRRAHKSP